MARETRTGGAAYADTLYVQRVLEMLPVQYVRDEPPMRRMPDALHARFLSGLLPNYALCAK